MVPAPGTVTPPQGSIRRQSRALECLAPPRKGSFRQQRHSPVHQNAPQDRPPLAFCKRRLSWPEVDARSTSGYVFDIKYFYKIYLNSSFDHLKFTLKEVKYTMFLAGYTYLSTD